MLKYQRAENIPRVEDTTCYSGPDLKSRFPLSWYRFLAAQANAGNMEDPSQAVKLIEQEEENFTKNGFREMDSVDKQFVNFATSCYAMAEVFG